MNCPKVPHLLVLILSLAITVSSDGGPSAIGIREEKVVSHVEAKLNHLAENVLGNDREKFVDYTSTSGIWDVKSDSTWCSGFIPGMFWYIWDLTGDSAWRDKAMHWTEGVRSRATATDNDTGFQIYDSFGLGYQFDESLRANYGPVLLQGAATLVNERYNSNIGCFRSWNQNISNPTTLPFEVNIDQMMNMELILWAGLNGGPAEYVDYAVSHADKTWEHNIREDGGTYHVVGYNLDGTVDFKRTHQGWTAESTWSRGQAWAIYGYLMFYRYTGLERMLDRAIICLNYYIQQTVIDANELVPFSDFDAPLDGDNPRDSSAAAIVASALIELSQITGSKGYLSMAENMLDSLSSPKYFSLGTSYQSFLLAASEKWDRPEKGASFGDYFFLEALWRWKQIPKDPGVVTGSWGPYSILDKRFTDTGDMMGWIQTSKSPYIYNYQMEGWLYAAEETVSSEGGWFFKWRKN